MCEVWLAKQTVVMKRSMAVGYAVSGSTIESKMSSQIVFTSCFVFHVHFAIIRALIMSYFTATTI